MRNAGLPRLGYQPSFDGVRAVAVCSVIGFHFYRWPLAGGEGVTIFFVLSGFLITALLREEWQQWGYISLPQIYRKAGAPSAPRARLLPVRLRRHRRDVWSIPVGSDRSGDYLHDEFRRRVRFAPRLAWSLVVARGRGAVLLSVAAPSKRNVGPRVLHVESCRRSGRWRGCSDRATRLPWLRTDPRLLFRCSLDRLLCGIAIYVTPP